MGDSRLLLFDCSTVDDATDRLRAGLGGAASDGFAVEVEAVTSGDAFIERTAGSSFDVLSTVANVICSLLSAPSVSLLSFFDPVPFSSSVASDAAVIDNNKGITLA